MAHTEFCYINKNTPELRNKLEEIGLIFSNAEVKHPDESEYLKVYLSYAEKGPIRRINCGNNEEFFLALAATKGTLPYMQWFWHKDKMVQCIGIGSTITADRLCSLKFKTENSEYIEVMIDCVRKATVEEIVEHFKA